MLHKIIVHNVQVSSAGSQVFFFFAGFFNFLPVCIFSRGFTAFFQVFAGLLFWGRFAGLSKKVF